jgi:glutamate N-acetyltransferase/amino-acid N-acetyltransferase
MLGFITTDVSISKAMLEGALSDAADESFNMISIDGDMSTNDSLFIMANGLAGNRKITGAGKDYKVFLEALRGLCISLAKMLAADGEGETKLVEIKVLGAKTDESARIIARKISTSNLLKCAIFGEDPNWGRVAASAGSAGVDFDPGRADIYLGPAKVLSGGSSMKTFDKEKVRKYITGKEVFIKVDLKSGKGSATAWTCDFLKEYVTINSEYST